MKIIGFVSDDGAYVDRQYREARIAVLTSDEIRLMEAIGDRPKLVEAITKMIHGTNYEATAVADVRAELLKGKP